MFLKKPTRSSVARIFLLLLNKCKQYTAISAINGNKKRNKKYKFHVIYILLLQIKGDGNIYIYIFFSTISISFSIPNFHFS